MEEIENETGQMFDSVGLQHASKQAHRVSHADFDEHLVWAFLRGRPCLEMNGEPAMRGAHGGTPIQASLP